MTKLNNSSKLQLWKVVSKRKCGEKMAKLKVQRAFDEFLLNPNLSLRAKGFPTMVLTNNITHCIEIKEHCTDFMDDIKDTLLELRINKYIKYNSELNILEANAVTYTKWNEEEYEL